MCVPHHPDEHRRQERKNIRLEKRHQQLKQHHEYHERDGAAATSQLPKMKIKPSSARITKCPAVMFANNRSVSANGLTIFPMISIGVMMSAISTAPMPVIPGGTNTIVLR